MFPCIKIKTLIESTMSFQIVSILLFLSIVVSVAVSMNIPNGRFRSLQDVQRILQLWNRYFNILEKQGLTTESDRNQIGILHILII